MTDQHSRQELDLPSPGSPTQLDTRVLKYAREQAPAIRSYLPPAWLSGAAAASVVVVAVLLVYPQPWDKVTNPNKLAREELIVRESFADEDAPPADQNTRARAELRSLSAIGQTAGLTLTQDIPNSAAPPPKAKKHTSLAFKSEPILAEKTSATDLLSTDAIAGPALPPLDEQAIRDSLIEIKKLLSTGDTEQAEQSWLALKHRCPCCDLPAELNEAMALYLPIETE
jgi:hypothetical protein